MVLELKLRQKQPISRAIKKSLYDKHTIKFPEAAWKIKDRFNDGQLFASDPAGLLTFQVAGDDPLPPIIARFIDSQVSNCLARPVSPRLICHRFFLSASSVAWGCALAGCFWSK